MNRRNFIHSSAALAGWAAVAPALRAAGGPTRKMKVALVPGSVGVVAQSQRELNDLAHRHRFEAVEPRAAEIAAMSAAQIDEVTADLAAKQLTWAAAGLTVDFRKDEAVFREGMGKLPAIAAGLRQAGAMRVGTWLGPSHAKLTYRENFRLHAARLAEIAGVLDGQGLRLGLEYVGTQLSLIGGRYPFVHTMAETRELIAEIGRPNVGLVLDSWHWWQAGDNVEDIVALKNSDVVSVDLNDAPKGLAKGQQKDGERELPLATGVIDLAAFVNALGKIGYDGPARPEPFNKALNALENDPACAACSEAMHRAMALIRA
jgi:hydroxypyruvate isomerase